MSTGNHETVDDKTDRQRLEHLFATDHACVYSVTFEEQYVLDLVRNIHNDRHGQSGGEADGETWVWSFTRGLHRLAGGEDDKTIKSSEHPAAALDWLGRRSGRGVAVMLDLARQLEDPKVVRLLRDAIEHFDDLGGTLILVDAEDKLPSAITAWATRFEPSLPDGEEIEQIVRSTLRDLACRKPVKIEINRSQLHTIVKNLRGLNRRQTRQVICEAVEEDRKLSEADLNTVLSAKRQLIGGRGLLEYVQTPVSLDEVGGMRRLKYWLAQRQETAGKKARAFGLRPPRGVLMLGVQGAGKSMCAKAIATAWHWPLLRMDPGALYGSYIGQSEQRLQNALHEAEAMAPLVLWIDEIEKGFASAASRSADGGLSQRMFGTLLTWMQEHTQPVFLVATANDIEAMPPELFRKGRFDETFFVDLPDQDVRKQIFAIHLRQRERDPEDFDLDRLAEKSEGYSGSEIEQGILAAMYDAYSAGEKLNTKRIVDALEQSPPLSVTMAEKVDALRQWAQGRCVPAD